MTDLTPEEVVWLVEYCMKPENTQIALRIGEIQPDLEKEIRQSFLKDFRQSLGERMREVLSDSWEPRELPELKVDWSDDNQIYVVKKEAVEIQLLYQPHEDNKLYIGVYEVSPQLARLEKGRLAPVFERKGLSLESDPEDYPDYHWWFYPKEENYTRLEDARRLRFDKEVLQAMVDYFAYKLVFAAEAISKELTK